MRVCVKQQCLLWALEQLTLACSASDPHSKAQIRHIQCMNLWNIQPGKGSKVCLTKTMTSFLLIFFTCLYSNLIALVISAAPVCMKEQQVVRSAGMEVIIHFNSSSIHSRVFHELSKPLCIGNKLKPPLIIIKTVVQWWYPYFRY